MLIGNYSVRVTSKNRIAMPKKFREQIGEKIIVAKWYEGCVVVVAKGRWEEILLKLTSQSKIYTKPVRETDRFILGSAFEVELDSQGRFVIPRSLKDYASLKEEAVFVGLGNRVEIWDKEIWNKKEKVIQKQAAEMIEKLSKKEE